MSLRQFYILLLSISASFLSSTINAQDSSRISRQSLPEIGVVASDTIPIDKELLIGDVFMRQMRGQGPFVNDPVLDEYIQDLGNRLVIEAENVKFPFTFFLLNNEDINAFAFFGGHIGIHTGLIYHADSESELASVVAHEIAHVTQRHIARGLQSAERNSPLQIASLLGGILIAATTGNPQATMAAISAGQAVGAQMRLNYTRSNEQEADRLGITMLARAGFDPNGAASFFGKLAAQTRLVSKPPARLLSHPLPESRIADARNRASTLPSVNVKENLAFHLAKARITARYIFDTKYALEYYADAIVSADFIPSAAQYGYALALLRNQKSEEALAVIKPLFDSAPDNTFYIDTYTDILVELGRYEQSIEMLKNRLSKTPRNAVITLNLANVANISGNYTLATDVLRDFLLLNPDHFLSHQLLSDAYGNSKQFLEMHQTKAEMYALLAAFPRAIDELQHAYNFTQDNHLEKQRIRARIQQLRDEKDKIERLL